MNLSESTLYQLELTEDEYDLIYSILSAAVAGDGKYGRLAWQMYNHLPTRDIKVGIDPYKIIN